MASGPLVSIVIPCFNQGQYLSVSLGSALAQTYPDVEVVIVDDASTDPETRRVLEELESQGKKVVRLAENEGPPGARNAGIRQATGEYVLPLDADNRIAPQYVEKAVTVLGSRPEVGIVTAHADLFGEREGPWELPEYSIGQELAGNCIDTCSFFRRSDWERLGGYDPEFRSGLEDWDFWLAIIGLEREVVRLSETLFSYRYRSDSLLRSMKQEEVRAASARIFRKHIALYVKHAEEFLAYVDTAIGKHYAHAIEAVGNLESQRAMLEKELFRMGQEADRARIQAEKVALELGLAREKAKTEKARFEDERRERGRLQSENVHLRERAEGSQAALSSLRSSWSFRIGLALTCPLRLVYELLRHGPITAYRRTILPLYPSWLRRWTDRWYARMFSTGVSPWSGTRESVTGPLVSVVIPVYDRTDELRSSIQSILDQTFRDFEIILVTDGSPRETLDVLVEFSGNPKVHVFEYPDNTGNAVRGRNRGIIEARGKYVAFQDSDDVAQPRRLEWSVAELEKGEVDVVYGGWRARLDGSRQIEDLQDGQEVYSPDCDLESLLEACVPCQSTVMVRRDALLDVGGLKPEMEYREDHELWCRLAYYGYRFKALHAVLTDLKLHKGNNELNFAGNSDKWFQALREQYRTKSFLPLKVAFLIPGTGISGGIYVVFEHATRLRGMGHDVTILTRDPIRREDLFWHPGAAQLQWRTYREVQDMKFDVCFATWWQTAYDLAGIPAHHHAYFNQSVESRFYPESETEVRRMADDTYRLPYPVVTEATWIRDLIRKEYGKEAYLVRNGIRKDLYRTDGPAIAPRQPGKLRVLVEGPLEVPFKNVAQTIELCRGIADELWLFTSSDVTSVPGIDRVFSRVPITEGPAIYRSCDVLVKLSLVEGMFGPPLEMFHCGGTAIVYDVSGHDEYISDGHNALVARQGDEEAVQAHLRSLHEDPEVLARLKQGALDTAAQWPDWETSSRQFEEVVRSIIAPHNHPSQ